jgi:hypothetical protein
MQSFGGSELDAGGIALSAVNRLDRLAPAQATRQFYCEHPNLSPLLFIKTILDCTERHHAHPVTGGGEWFKMSKDDLAARIAEYRQTAEALRGIAEQLRFDLRRGNQLRALADGFERFAIRLEGGIGNY